MGLFSSKPTTVTSTQSLPAGLENVPQRLGAIANTIADRPYSPFPGGSRIAPLNPRTRGALEAAAGGGDMDYSQLIRRSATPLNTRSAATRGALNGLMNPYTEAVVDRTLASIDRQEGIAGNTARRRNARQGAFGGARAVIEDSERMERFDRTRGDQEAGLRSRAYEGALGQFNTEENRRAQVGSLNRNNDARAVQMLLSQGQVNNQNRLSRVNPALALQSYDQSVLSDQVGRFNEAQDYPLKQAGALTSIISGVPRTTSQTQSGGGQSMFNNILGGASTLVGLGGATGAFGKEGWLTGLFANGGRVGYADGGEIDGLDDDGDEGFGDEGGGEGGSSGNEPVMISSGALTPRSSEGAFALMAPEQGALTPRVTAMGALGRPVVTMEQYQAALEQARPQKVERASAFEGYDNPFLQFGLALLGGDNIGKAGLGALQALTQKNQMAKREELQRQQSAQRQASELGKMIAARQTAEARAAGVDATAAAQLQGREFDASAEAARQAERLRVQQSEGAADRSNRIAVAQMQAALEASSPTADMKNLAAMLNVDVRRLPAALAALPEDQRASAVARVRDLKGGGVNIDQRTEGAFDKRVAEDAADAFIGAATLGRQAGDTMQIAERFGELLNNVNTGRGAETITALKSFGATLGLGLGNVGEAEAIQALGNRLAQGQRKPGEGSMSDSDLKFFIASVPGLSRSREGNRIMLEGIKRQAELDAQFADVARDLEARRGLSPSERRRELDRARAQFQKDNPFITPEFRRQIEVAKSGRADPLPAPPRGNQAPPAAARPLAATTAPAGLPPGAVQEGTSGGRPVYRLPDGRRVIQQGQ
jgi:hypothetical protein